MDLYHDALDRRDPSAALEIGTTHHQPNPVLPANTDWAIYWLEIAAERGNLNSQWNLAMIYQRNSENYAKAAYWFREAALQGSANAQNRLAWMYDNGEGVEQNDAETTYWYQKAAEQGDPAGENNYAWMLDLGQCVEQSDTEAMAWYHKSAAQGFMNAQFSLGSMYELGQGIERDDEVALNWYALANDQREQDAVVHYQVMLMESRREVRTDAELVAFYRKLDEEEESSAAQYNLGLMYEKGLLGIEKDIRVAMEWYRKAADQTHENARQRLSFFSRRYPQYIPSSPSTESTHDTPTQSSSTTSTTTTATV
ncbi:hypothetical protein BGW42_001367 [Actinomortierella wolfii]|nr:hypothetical protein BGW42_001367 [Actinomortierella wolfii]